MYSEHLYSNRDELEKEEVFLEPPLNKTLFIVQLTGNMPVKPEETEGLTTLADVFEYYKPSLDFEFLNGNQGTVNENIRFTCLEDFHPESIIRKSHSLNELLTLTTQLTEMNKKISTNSQLADILANTERKKKFTEMLKLLIDKLAATANL